MKGLKTILAAAVVLGVFVFSAYGAEVKTPRELLQEGIYAEETEGDLDAAIEKYEQVLDNERAYLRTAAQATYRLGMCYLKKGEKDAAGKYFREVVDKYPRQRSVVELAQAELEKLGPTVAGADVSLYEELPPGIINYIGGQYGVTCAEAGVKQMYANGRIYYVNNDFVVKQGGMGYYYNFTGQPAKGRLKLGGTSYPNQTHYDVAGRKMDTEIVPAPGRKDHYDIYWTPEEPIAPGQFFSYGWSLHGAGKLSPMPGADKYMLIMQNHLGTRGVETFFLVVPEGVTIESQTAEHKGKETVAGYDVYWWTEEVQPDTNHVVNVVLGKDEGIVGRWRSVDFVTSIEQFEPGTQSWKGDLFLKEASFYRDGRSSLGCTWTDGWIHDDDGKTKAQYHIKTMDGEKYLFMPWLSGDVTIRGMKPKYYVLKAVGTGRSGPRDVAVISEGREIVGEWRSVDFVSSIDHFEPGTQSWQGDLFLKEASFYRDGTSSLGWRWRDGWIHHDDGKTKAQYYIKRMDGERYLFLPWLSGDVTIRGRKPCYYVLKAVEKAVSAADRRESESLAVEGWKLWQGQKFADAEAKFKEAVELDPKNENAWQGLGWAQFNQGKSLNAKDSFEKCIALNPKNSAALNGLGWIANAKGDKDEAIKWWEKAVEAMPAATASLNGLTRTYMERGDYEKATKYYRMWLKVEPDNKDAREGLERALAGKPKVSVEAIEQLIKQMNSEAGFEALNKLIDIGEPAVPALIEVMKTTGNWQVPKALGAIGDRRAISPLIEKLKKSDTSPMKDVVAEALENITGEKFGTDAVKWESWWQEQRGVLIDLRTPESTIRSFMDAALKLDAKQAMRCVAPESHDYDDIKEIFESKTHPFNEMFKRADRSVPVRIERAEISGNMCTAVWHTTLKESYSLEGKTWKSGETFELDGNLRKYDRKWLITGI